MSTNGIFSNIPDQSTVDTIPQGFWSGRVPAVSTALATQTPAPISGLGGCGCDNNKIEKVGTAGFGAFQLAPMGPRTGWLARAKRNLPPVKPPPRENTGCPPGYFMQWGKCQPYQDTMAGFGVNGAPPTTGEYVYTGLAVASSAACAYHGYKRNNGSVGWAIGWWLLGGLLPVVAPVIAVAQGYAKPKGR
jgi:hypothetical protein